MPFSEDKYSLFAKYLLIYSSALAETKGKLSYYSTSVGYYDLGVCYWIYKAQVAEQLVVKLNKLQCLLLLRV